MFRADHLACWSLGKTISPTRSRAQLPGIFVYELSIVHFGMSIDVILVLLNIWATTLVRLYVSNFRQY